MAEEHTQQPSPRGKSRRERVEHARSRDILDVANELSMELVQSGRDYRWKEHDSMVISPEKNMWNWFSRHQGGDVIALVQTMKEVNFNQAIDFLNDGTFKEFTHVERVQEPFTYYLQPYEQPFEAARNYLKEQRGLSDETIDFFLEKGVLAQANAKVNGSIEPVVVFKSFDFSGEIVGATLQGIEENWEKWPERGYAKNIVRNSDGITGMHVDIGQPNRLIFAESAIDLMSYYELNREKLQDVRLVSMDGLKESVVGRHLAQLQADISGRPLRWTHDQLAEGLQTAIDNNFFTDGKHANWITLAVDNDEGGRNFISSLREKGAVVIEALPPERIPGEKADWNDTLKRLKAWVEEVKNSETISERPMVDYREQVNDLILDITKDDTGFYLWHDEELKSLEVDDAVLEEFHHNLGEEQYQIAGAKLYVEESINDGATGYLSLEGHALDENGIRDYLSNQEFSEVEQVEFLEKLQAELPSVWDKVLTHYDKELETIIGKYNLAGNQKDPRMNQSIGLDIVFETSNNPTIAEKYSSGDIVPYVSFVKDLYVANNEDYKRKSEDGLYPRMHFDHSEGTWFAIRDEQGNTLVKECIYDVGYEFAPLSERLNRVIPEEYLEYAKQIDSDISFSTVSVESNQDSGTEVKLYNNQEQIDTLDFNDLFNHTDLEMMANELGHTDFNEIPGTYSVSIAGIQLSQEQVDGLIDRMINEEVDSSQLKQLLSSDKFDLISYIAHQDADSLSSVDLEQKEKSLENHQETNTGGELFNRNSSFLGENSPGTAPQPVELKTQPIFPTNVRLYFTTDDGNMSNKAFRKNLRTLNLYANTMRDSAQWYLSEVADTTMRYVYKTPQEEGLQVLSVHFDKKNWMHLTGVTPVYDNWVDSLSEQFIDDIAQGKGHFKNLKFALGTPDKLKVLNLLPEIIESDTFVFNDLSSVKKLNNLDLSQALNPEDSDLLLLFKDEGLHRVPASLMRLKGDLEEKLSNIDSGTVLGVYRERDGQIDQLSVNEEFVKDGGQEMLSILENKQYEEALEPSQEIVQSDTISAELFTQVLDAAYNVGDPRQLGTELPEESKAAWEHYYELSDGHDGNFTAVIAAADQQELVDKSSHFYQEWHQDRIYNETYHVRLQWSEIWPDGPQIPFKETELVEYQTFAEELYKQNRALYDSHQESLATGNQADYVPFTKVKFDVYAPGGILIKDNIRYDIGDETEPISRLLGLGYRRLEGQPELAAIDEKILSQLEKQEVNQEIATEANEQNLKMPDILLDETNNPREHFQSPNQEMKVSLAQRLEEIMAEESVKNPVRENEQEHPVTSDEPFDYTSASAFEISEHAFQKIREYTQSPEDLMEYMDFMSKFPQLSPRNVALIHEQWNGANAVATYDQWQAMGETLGIKPDDVIQTKATYTNKRTGETKEIVHQGLSVKTGEKSKITLFRPVMAKMIPVLDEHGQQLKNDKGNPKYKKLSDATPQEKVLVKEGKLPVRQFQERDPKTGYPRFTTYKVFELSQTTLKPESYPKAMPNRHYNFNVDKVKTKEVLEGLCDYADSIGVKMMKDEAHVLGNAKGAFFPDEQIILINPDNTPGEKIATTIHELAHATLHNPKMTEQYKENVPLDQKELEAEMTSHLLSKHFGLDTSEKAIDYMAGWTNNLKALDDKQLADSLKRVHKTVSKMLKKVESHTKPHQVGKNRGQAPNFPKAPTKGPSR
ncbi:PBECR4 domain-containing protein [Streptococcus agalactiae]|uniref:PBECR4 domain-containing protein n=1 Tax=Streptococcus agalactiae TaxID=1311 RepID=UPI002109B602|nr:PBECR4 domain-containing protein [Streptococcus agalactiae]MCQ3826371.1 toprim domain-containing protein [Streptococcus agalactiae]